jgi:plastocyanin
MKKFVLIFAVLFLKTALGFATTYTITNSDFTFVPDNLSINHGDVVIFQIGSIHTVVEVDQSTWDANGNTPLTGGFSLPASGGELTGITVGTHYYVCGNHYFMGMKGIIIVSPAAGIETFSGINFKSLNVENNNLHGIYFIRFSDRKNTFLKKMMIL